jgi:hypothetical protein
MPSGGAPRLDGMPIALPGDDTRWRCTACGNLTRFDVVRSVRTRDFVHADLSGAQQVEESEVLTETVEQVTCRWCNGVDTVELVARPSA